MQHADQGEQAARGFEIDIDLPRQTLRHQLRAFVVQAAPPHVDGLNALFTSFLDRLDVAIDQHLVVLHQPAERSQRQADGGQRTVGSIADIENQTAFQNGKMQRVRTGLVGADQWREMVRRRQIRHRLLTVCLDIRGQLIGRISIEDHAMQPGSGDGSTRHGALMSLLSMFRLSMSPTVPPLMGRSKPSAKKKVRGTKIADMTQIGGCPMRSTTNSSGTMMWPVTKMVK